jgi:predicted N-acyltransferase
LWKEVIQKSFGYEPMYFILEDEKNEITGGMPAFFVKSWLTGKRLVSLSFSDYCDFLVQSEEDRCVLVKAMVETAKKYGASSVDICLRSDDSRMEQLGFRKAEVYKHHVLNISESLEVIKGKRIDKNYRYDIRKAERSGITLVFGEDETDIKVYYELYVGTRKYHGLPPLPYAFFRNLWENLASSEMLWLMLAVEKSRPIAGILVVRFGNTIYALSNSSDRNYLDRRPNHLLWWKTIEIGHEKGLNYLDFGRTATDNTGLLAFKRNWGTAEYDITYFKVNQEEIRNLELRKSNFKRGFVNKVCKVLPNFALKAGSGILYKHMG